MDAGSNSGKAERKLVFTKGLQVEVSPDEEGFKDAWYVATVLESPSHSSSKKNTENQNKVYVEYQSIFADEHGSQHLREYVNVAFVRPLLPVKTDFCYSFGLNDVVGAYCRDGWWTGIITRVLENSRFVVTFQNPPDEIEVSASELRIHSEWIDGQWVRSEKQNVSIPSDCQELVEHVWNYGCGAKVAALFGSPDSTKDNSEGPPCSVNSSENQTQHSTPCTEGFSCVMTSQMKKMKALPSDRDNTHSRPLKKLKEGHVVEAPTSTACRPNMMSTETPIKEKLWGFPRPSSGYTEISFSNHSLDSDPPSAKTGSLSRGQKVQSKQSEQKKVGEQDSQTVGPGEGGKEGRATSQVKNPQPMAGEGNGVGNAAEDFVEKECITKEYELPSITGLDGLRSLRIEKPHQFPNEESLKLMRDQKQQMDDPTLYKTMGDQLVGGESNQKKKGRPRKSLINSPKASVTAAGVGSTMGSLSRSKKRTKLIGDGKKPTDGSAEQEKEINHVTKRVLQASSKHQKQHPSKRGRRKTNSLMIVSGIQGGINLTEQENKISRVTKRVLQASSKHQKKHPSKSGRRKTTSLMTGSRIQDSKDAYGGKTAETDYKMEELEPIDKLPSNVSDDISLLTWFEGSQSPTTADFSISSGRTMQQSTEASDRCKETVMQSSVVQGQGDTLPCENRKLPFVKNTMVLWQMIEDREVFQKLPQKPHFHPLKYCRESLREGFAIGFMVTFSSVVEKTSALRFDEPKSTIEDSLEALGGLETHGFDVQVVRDRLTKLLVMKETTELLQDQIKEVNIQMVEHTTSKTKFDGEIDEIDKQIRELQEKRAIAISMKEMKERQIASLQSRLDGINEGIRTSGSDFEGLAASPW